MAFQLKTVLLTASVLLGLCQTVNGQEVTAASLVREFYALYPCVTPHSAYQMAKTSPKVAFELLKSERPVRERYVGYRVIVDARLPGYKQTIEQGLSDVSSQIQGSAFHDLELILKEEELVKKAIELLGSKSSTLRYNAAEKLQHHATPEAIEPMLKLLGDEFASVRHRAAGTLFVWQNEKVNAKLRELIRSKDITIAGTAALSLSIVPDGPIPSSPLNAYLKDELKKIKGPKFEGREGVNWMIQILSRSGDQSSLPVLESAAKHENVQVRDAAAKAIAAIGSRLDGNGK